MFAFSWFIFYFGICVLIKLRKENEHPIDSNSVYYQHIYTWSDALCEQWIPIVSLSLNFSRDPFSGQRDQYLTISSLAGAWSSKWIYLMGSNTTWSSHMKVSSPSTIPWRSILVFPYGFWYFYSISHIILSFHLIDPLSLPRRSSALTMRSARFWSTRRGRVWRKLFRVFWMQLGKYCLILPSWLSTSISMSTCRITSATGSRTSTRLLQIMRYAFEIFCNLILLCSRPFSIPLPATLISWAPL